MKRARSEVAALRRAVAILAQAVALCGGRSEYDLQCDAHARLRPLAKRSKAIAEASRMMQYLGDPRPDMPGRTQAAEDAVQRRFVAALRAWERREKQRGVVS